MLTAAEFITWADRVANLPWPLNEEEFDRAVARYGWKVKKFPNGEVPGYFSTGFSAPSGTGVLMSDTRGVVKEVSLKI